MECRGIYIYDMYETIGDLGACPPIGKICVFGFDRCCIRGQFRPSKADFDTASRAFSIVMK